MKYMDICIIMENLRMPSALTDHLKRFDCLCSERVYILSYIGICVRGIRV